MVWSGNVKLTQATYLLIVDQLNSLTPLAGMRIVSPMIRTKKYHCGD